jgi:D-serine deaminase-like pyridoxal phosphate-dependent protein
MNAWYQISNEQEVDSPALLIYPNRVKNNIQIAKGIVQEVSALRPHVKTNKMQEITEMLLAAGISKFKCATIAEAEMLALAGAKDILLAYQPNPVKAKRLLTLQQHFPQVQFACLLDNSLTAQSLSDTFRTAHLQVYLDLNVGMNRTGIKPENAQALYQSCLKYLNLQMVGLHAYDGHLRDSDVKVRKQKADGIYMAVLKTKEQLEAISGKSLSLVMGGTPTFPLHAQRPGVETSPGTFVFWDEGYRNLLPDLPFQIAAVLLVRVISVIDAETLCLDLGHKSVAAENPFPRVKFLNYPEAEAIGQSEEHLVVRVKDAATHQVGEVWYGVPYHICPTVALYDAVGVIEDHQYVGNWKVIARDRAISV